MENEKRYETVEVGKQHYLKLQREQFWAESLIDDDINELENYPDQQPETINPDNE